MASPFCSDWPARPLRSPCWPVTSLPMPSTPFLQHASWIWSAEGTHAVPPAGQGSPSHYQVRYFRRTFEVAEAEAFLANKQIGPLEGFRSKAGWPFTAEMKLVFSEEDKNWKLEFDFGDDKNAEETGELVDFGDQPSLGACPKCGAPVREHGSNYVCEKAVPTAAQPTPSCDFKSGQIILQQPIEREQMTKLLATGKTDMLEKFVSMRTRRAFKAYLTYDAEAGKVSFAFEPSKYPKKGGAPTTAALAKAAGKTLPGKKTPAGKKAAKAVKETKPKAPRKAAAGKAPKTGINRPSSDNSPRLTTPSTASLGKISIAAKTAKAIGKSKCDPSFGRSAGDRFTVMRLDGSAIDIAPSAARGVHAATA